MPLRYFASDLTPNDAFFVRWHSGILTSVDTRTLRLEVTGMGGRRWRLAGNRAGWFARAGYRAFASNASL